MPLTVTAWQLRHLSGDSARCLVSQRGESWQVVVWNRHGVAYWERYDSDEGALDRADDLWRLLVACGWATDPPMAQEPYRRSCLTCQRRNVVVTRRWQSQVTLFCTACRRGWGDRERAGGPDRRAHRRDADRRVAA